MLPLLAGLGMMAGGAAAKGLGNYISGQDEEEKAKKNALRQLASQYSDGKYALAPEIEEAPGAWESVAMPVGGAVIGSLGEDWEDKKGDFNWKAGAKAAGRGFGG